jgi:hypothetical protein
MITWPVRYLLLLRVVPGGPISVEEADLEAEHLPESRADERPRVP